MEEKMFDYCSKFISYLPLKLPSKKSSHFEDLPEKIVRRDKYFNWFIVIVPVYCIHTNLVKTVILSIQTETPISLLYIDVVNVLFVKVINTHVKVWGTGS